MIKIVLMKIARRFVSRWFRQTIRPNARSLLRWSSLQCKRDSSLRSFPVSVLKSYRKPVFVDPRHHHDEEARVQCSNHDRTPNIFREAEFVFYDCPVAVGPDVLVALRQMRIRDCLDLLLDRNWIRHIPQDSVRHWKLLGLPAHWSQRWWLGWLLRKIMNFRERIRNRALASCNWIVGNFVDQAFWPPGIQMFKTLNVTESRVGPTSFSGFKLF